VALAIHRELGGVTPINRGNHIGSAMWEYRESSCVVLKKDGEAAQANPATLEALGLKE
jgi:hypothetical protein